MSSQIEKLVPDEIDGRLQLAGAAGCGGAGFPSYAKWQEAADIDHLLVNHQESEPTFYADKWLLRTNAEAFATFFDVLLEQVVDTIVVGAKAKDRSGWMEAFEAATDATVYMPDDLPLDVEEEDGVVVAYTKDRFQYGMETCLLSVTAGVRIGDDLPSDHGWVVHNTETLYNVQQALMDDEPVTHKYVHVGGDVPQHRFLRVPVGTPASALLEAAGSGVEAIGDDQLLVEGGPGWGFEMDRRPRAFGVRKNSNGILVADADTVETNSTDDGRVDLLDATDWRGRAHETEPTRLRPERVRIPLLTNPAYEGLVAPSDPVVEPGDRVAEGDVVARARADGISIAQHASIDGTVVTVTETCIEVEHTQT